MKFQYPVINSVTPIQQKKEQLLTVKNLTDKSADLYVYGQIVDDTDMKWDEADVMPDDVLQVLNSDGLEELNIYVNSPGGSVFAGLAIYNILSRNKAKKTVYVDGVAASMASAIALVGDQVYIPSNAFMMIHKPLTIAIGNASDFRKLAEDLDTIESGLTKIYEDNLQDGMNMETIKQMMEEETWLSGEEAAKYFNVEVIESKNIAACTGDILDKYDKTPKKLLQNNKPDPESDNDPKPGHEAEANQDEKLKIQNELDLLEL